MRPWLITGLSLLPSPVAIPTNLLPQQPGGCLVWPYPDLVLDMPIDASGGAFVSAVTLAVPNQPALAGATWFHQWFALFEQCDFARCNPHRGRGRNQRSSVVAGAPTRKASTALLAGALRPPNRRVARRFSGLRTHWAIVSQAAIVVAGT